jgi:hypothetical protein
MQSISKCQYLGKPEIKDCFKVVLHSREFQSGLGEWTQKYCITAAILRPKDFD